MKHTIHAVALAAAALTSVATAQAELGLPTHRARAGQSVHVEVRGAVTGVVVESDLLQASTTIPQSRLGKAAIGTLPGPGFFPISVHEGERSRHYLLIATGTKQRLDVVLSDSTATGRPRGMQESEFAKARAAAAKLRDWTFAVDGRLGTIAADVGEEWLFDNAIGIGATFTVCATAPVVQPLWVVCGQSLAGHAADYALALGTALVDQCPDLDSEERKLLLRLIDAGGLVKTVALSSSKIQLAVGTTAFFAEKTVRGRNGKLAIKASSQWIDKFYVLLKHVK